MKNFLKNIDINQIKGQIEDIREQMRDIRFRKPWTRGGETSPYLFMLIGAALTWTGLALYRNRTQVAEFCHNCGADLRGKLETGTIKEKAGRFFGKAKVRTEEAMETAR